jgi:hypothetical protein
VGASDGVYIKSLIIIRLNYYLTSPLTKIETVTFEDWNKSSIYEKSLMTEMLIHSSFSWFPFPSPIVVLPGAVRVNEVINLNTVL